MTNCASTSRAWALRSRRAQAFAQPKLENEMPNIGLLNEKPLHAALKTWYAQPGDQFEVAVNGFVIDLVHDGVLVEIQTRSFTPIKRKLLALTREYRIRLLYPIAQEKWIAKPSEHGNDAVTRRKSPKRGRVEDLFWEMVSFPQLLTHPNFSLEVLLIKEEELRRYDGKRGWRKKGWVVAERRLLEVVERRLFAQPKDWLAFLPQQTAEPFTTKDLAEANSIRRPLAQKMAYCLCQAQLIRLLGKRGRSNLYERYGDMKA